MGPQGGKAPWRPITSKARNMLDRWQMYGAGHSVTGFMDRFKYSIRTYYVYRRECIGFAAEWDNIKSRNKDRDNKKNLVGDAQRREERVKLLPPKFVVWLSRYEETGKRAFACKEAMLRTEDVEAALAENSDFRREFDEINKLRHWDIQDELKVQAASGKAGAMNAYLEAYDPAFRKKVEVDHLHIHSFDRKQLDAATERWTHKFGEMEAPKALPASNNGGDVIEAEYAEVAS
jgi:hypothetical protein